jgi:predicted dehydrogenase
MTGNLCRPEMEGEDHAFMVLRFAGSALAGIQASYGRKRPNWQDGWPSGYRLEMTFWGTAGAVRYRLCPEPLLEIADDSAWKRIGTGASFVSSFICQFEHFLDCVDGGAAPKATLRDGLEVLAALRAGYETRSQTDKVDA